MAQDWKSVANPEWSRGLAISSVQITPRRDSILVRSGCRALAQRRPLIRLIAHPPGTVGGEAFDPISLDDKPVNDRDLPESARYERLATMTFCPFLIQ